MGDDPRISLLDRLLPWRRVPVELRFGPRMEAGRSEALAGIGGVLHGESECCDDLKTPVAELWSRFQDARSTAELIRVASQA